MNKFLIGLVVGSIAGVLDVIPMVFMKLPLDADLSAFVTCVIGGFFIATSGLTLNNVLKGIVIFFLLAFPIMIIVGAQNLADLPPMVISNLVLGSLMGWAIGRFGRTK